MCILRRHVALLITVLTACSTVSAWTHISSIPRPSALTSISHIRSFSYLHMASNDAIESPSTDDNDDDDDEEEETPPGKMRVSEIKSELDLRKVPYADCFDRESLEKRLLSARSTGMADPSIVDKFNKQNLEATFKGEKLEVNDDDIEKAVGGDGTLPGGMPPEMLKELMSNPELMQLLQSTKMQDAMKLMMTGGQEALENAMENDRETYEVVMKLNKIMAKGAGGGGTSSGTASPPPPPPDAFQ